MIFNTHRILNWTITCDDDNVVRYIINVNDEETNYDEAAANIVA